ncbi:copper amine oxidase N-terminal domain-containing protein [Aminipila butyrica]|uniref:Copper amine oxidase N-terminal domain-containing protein n=1 Tax=Aminipila butyrica TaxID=433296 RepID=A0A858BZJ0_9FIRM|nr:copper amine oxidase N-terminal domain-containing protein [Aminipila butyrica]QIB70350.1 copper amine oxidase N-terminal domain-containing protein [Aminipila butyrica]
MKKKAILKILTGALCLTLITSTAAFADTGVQAGPVLADGGNDVQEVQQQEQQFVVEEGIIEQITDQGEAYRIQIKNDNMGMIFFVKADLFVFDQASGKQIAVQDLKKDMRLTAILPANAAVTLSIPAQTGHVTAFIVRSDSSSLNVSVYDDSLVNQDNTLKLNLSEKTKVLDTKGSKRLYTAEDIANKTCVVLYTVSTRSIPAQTTPENVILLEEAAPEQAAPAYVSLRAAAEAKGYQVKWTSNEKPIVLTKNDMEIQLTVGSDAFQFTHQTKDLKALDQVEKMDLPVVLQGGQTMVADSFVKDME